MNGLDLTDSLGVSLLLHRESFRREGCEYTPTKTARVPGFGLLEEATILAPGGDPYLHAILQVDEDDRLTIWAQADGLDSPKSAAAFLRGGQ